MWIGAVCELLPSAMLTQKSTSITGEGIAPPLLGLGSYCALADSLGGLHGSGRTCGIRRARRRYCGRIDEDVVEDGRCVVAGPVQSWEAARR